MIKSKRRKIAAVKIIMTLGFLNFCLLGAFLSLREEPQFLKAEAGLDEKIEELTQKESMIEDAVPPREDIKEEAEENISYESSFIPVPEEFKRPLIERDLSYKNHKSFCHFEGFSFKNATYYDDKELCEILKTPMEMRFEETHEPQVFIYHTHATESFNPKDESFYDCRYNWRSRDNNQNMVAVGNITAKRLESMGIRVIHDLSQHDYPSYNGSYNLSLKSMEKCLEENPKVKIMLDLHRDAIQNDEGLITKPVFIKDGKKYAQIMIIANCDDGSNLIPYWRENFRFAKELYMALEKVMPGIARPVLLGYRKYNQQVSKGALLIEVGGHGNTLQEALNSGEILALAIKEVYEKFKI